MDCLISVFGQIKAHIYPLFSRTNTETAIGAACSSVGACFAFLVGGYDAPIQSLLVLIVADYATGMIAAWKTGTLSSNKGYKGMAKKISIVLVVAVANLLDTTMFANHFLRTAVICGYGGMEGLSLFENIDRAGYGEYIPVFLRTKLEQLRTEKGVKM